MHNDDTIIVPVDPPGPDMASAHYLEACRRAGVEPVPREQALGLIAKWTAMIVACLTPPTQHWRGAAKPAPA